MHTARCVHSLEVTTPDHQLWHSVHQFLALLLTEESHRITQSTAESAELTIAVRLDHLSKTGGLVYELLSVSIVILIIILALLHVYIFL